MNRRPGRNILPILYFVAAGVLAGVVLPSALRPPPDQTNAASALSPDAPPDDDPDTIIQSLQQAGSRTAGAQGRAEVTTTTVAPAAVAPTRGQCYGDPPRTGDSLYSAPCVPAWQPPPEGNGGATARNVFPDLVRLGVSHVIGNAREGPVGDEPEDNESSQLRTLRVLQAYFNANYETYGRKIQIVQLPASNANPTNNEAHAVKADEEYRVFAAYYLYAGFCEEMARRRLLTMCNPMPEEFHARHSPYVWAWMMDYSKVDRMGAEYICKKLVDRPAAFAGGIERGQPRKFGLLYQASAARNADRRHDYMARQLQQQCGLEATKAITVVSSTDTDSGGQYAGAVAQMRAAGVTSIVLQTELFAALEAMSSADSAGYNPEWLLFFPYGLDINIIGNILPPSQMQHAFGLSAWEQPPRSNQTDCYRAYKTIDPAGSPDGATCGNFFGPLQQLMNGIQLAGPNLTPETFRDGLYRQGHRFYPQPWAIGGGYGPGDHTYMDNMGEIWWSSSAQKPEDGSPGAYMWVDDGRRYREGEIPVGETQVFRNGTAVRARPGA